MPVYSIQFSGVTVSAIQDLFEITSPAAGVIYIHGYELFQISDYGDTQSEGLPLQWIRGYTTTGSGGATVTPVLTSGRDGVAVAVCKANNTGLATGGSGAIYMAGGFNAQGGAERTWAPEIRPTLRNSERGVLRLPTAPTDALTLYGTLYFEEL